MQKRIVTVIVLLFLHIYANVLDEYVNKPDPSYTYSLLSKIKIGDVDVYTLNMTSQTWLTTQEVNQPLWYHYVLIYVPPGEKIGDAYLIITGGSNDKIPSPDTSNVAVSKAVSSIVVELHDIPNQPLVFTSDPAKKRRVEDSIISFSWKKFLETLDPQWIPRLPMVKASVRAMDTAQDFIRKQIQFHITNFIVIGASKRGWTTWLVGAVDTKRVKAIVPIVIDVLKMTELFENIYRDLACHWPEAFQEYVNEGIMEHIHTEEFKKLAEIIDPLFYNDRLANTAKYIVNAGNDDFFQPDGSLLSFSELKGSKHIRYVPNVGHSLAGSDAYLSIISFGYGAGRNITLPNVTWKLENYTSTGAYLTVYIDKFVGKLPSKINLWQATNPTVRDFRITVVGKAWTSTLVNNGTSIEDSYTVMVRNPPIGYTAFMIELQYDNYYTAALPPLKFTTSAYITPNMYPSCQ